MTDNIRLYNKPEEPIEYFNNYPEIVDQNCTQHTRKKTKLHYYMTKFRNLTIEVDEHNIVVYGSINKFIKGNNYELTTSTEHKQAIQELNDYLKIEMGDSKISLIETGSIIELNNEPKDYFEIFQSLPRCKREIEGNDTLYFKNNSNKFVMYDKNKEAKKIPEAYKNKNILRYEYGIKKNVSQAIKERLILKDLTDPDKLTKLINICHHRYNQINKTNYMLNKELEINNKTLFIINAIGNKSISEYVQLHLSQINDSNATKQRKNKLKTELIQSIKRITIEDHQIIEMTNEIDTKIKNQKEVMLAMANN